MDLRLRMATAAEEWRQRGLPAVPAEERDAWVTQYARVACQRLCSPAPALSRRRTQTRRAAQAECGQESTRCVGSRAPSRCWPISLIYRSRLPIFRLNETCRWSQSNNRSLARFAVKQGRRLADRIRSYLSTMRLPRPCHVDCARLSLLVSPCRSLGHLSS